MKTKAQRSTRKRASLRQNLDAQLEHLENVQLLRHLVEEERGYIFKHALTQESAYQALTNRARREIHRHVAQAYVQIYADRCLDEFATLLAEHYAQAGDDRHALEYATRSGDQAARVYANDEALLQYARALDASPRVQATTEQLIHLYTRRGRVLEVMGKYSEALDSYEEMGALALKRDDRRLELASLLLRAVARAAPIPTFDARLAQEMLDRALALARELGDRAAEARVLWNLILLNNPTSQPERAVEYGEQALAVAGDLANRGEDVREQMAFILHDLSLPVILAGDRARGQAMQEQARALWQELDNKPMLVDNLGIAAQMADLTGDTAGALDYAAQAIAIAEKIGNPLGTSFHLAIQVSAYFQLGEFDRAFQKISDALALEASGQFVIPIPLPSLHALLLGHLGAFERAAEIEHIVRSRIEQPMPGHFRARAYAAMAQLNIARGEIEAAQADLGAALRDYAHGTLSAAAAAVAMAEAELALTQGNAARCLAITDEAIGLARKLQLQSLLPQFLYLRGRAMELQGELPESGEVLHQAADAAAAINFRWILWQILVALGQVQAKLGNMAESELLYRQAREIIQFMVEHMPMDLRQSFINLPRVRAVLETESTIQ